MAANTLETVLTLAEQHNAKMAKLALTVKDLAATERRRAKLETEVAELAKQLAAVKAELVAPAQPTKK